MTQRGFKDEYYYKLTTERRKEFRQTICRELQISEYDLYRRMRLYKFKAIEWKVVLDYVEYNPL